ncbi:TM7S3/TM198-like domain-containing protein [Microlunatus soli]|uniref:TM7S3/TM198-like domain-containing protein n=1 Tax=Microlunatus soli TaxID=630515 RepID=A0A1H1YXK5_9ACTN|nr:DUF4203 domain-containing protein [Microlunatus soli]SDT26181.1 protein of unknown function [Microlunatus soli]
MSGIVLMIIGAALCFLGARSVRVTIAVAGFGAAWLLADALHATWQLTILVGCAGAVMAFITTLLLARFVFFISGVCLGAVVGAKVFQLANGSDHNWLLAIIVVPAAGFLGGLLINRRRHHVLRWLTAFAGAALALSGLGRLWPDPLSDLWRPRAAVGGLLLGAAWIVLTVLGHRVQSAVGLGRRDADDRSSGRKQ